MPKTATKANGLSKPDPFEAASLPEIPAGDPILDDAMRDVLTAVNGFPYHGENATSIVGAIRWLRHNPEHVAVLFPQEVSA